jgi:hypothetical protein
MKVDLRNITFEDFLKFFFKHPIPTDKIKKDPWYWDNSLDIIYNPSENLNRFIQLFNSSDVLLQKYSREELEQGFWAIQSINLKGAIPDILEDNSLKIDQKQKLIEAMYSLFERLFSKEPLETSSHMWWDSFCFKFDMSEGVPKNSEDKMIQDSMFECQKKILDLPSYSCKISALHGLGHLKHPDTKEAIETFLSKEKDVSDEMKSWAEAAIEGEVP